MCVWRALNITPTVGWVTCYPPMVLISDDGPVRNELHTLRSTAIPQMSLVTLNQAVGAP